MAKTAKKPTARKPSTKPSRIIAKKSAGPARKATRRPEAEVERIPPIMQRPDDAMLWDIESVYGLVEALGGVEALGKTLRPCSHGDCTEHVLDWLRRGWIPPGWHLRLLGMAAAEGKTVFPEAFGMSRGDLGWQGLIANAHVVVADCMRLPTCTSCSADTFNRALSDACRVLGNPRALYTV